MKGGQPAETHQTTEVVLPDWVENASKKNYQFAKKVANRPLVQYQGDQVADPSTMTTQGYDYLMRNVGAQDPLYRNAAALQGRITQLDPLYGDVWGILAESNNLLRETACTIIGTARIGVWEF